MVRAHWNGAVIAESDDTVIEGNHHFPSDAVKSGVPDREHHRVGLPVEGHGVRIDTGTRAPRRSLLDRFRRRTGSDDETPAAGERAAEAVTDLDDASFFAALDHNVTVVDFWAPWCGPCQQLHPLFDAQAAAHQANGLQFARVDVDQNPAVTSTLGIMSIPTIIVFDGDGNEVEREIGVPGKRRLDQLTRGAELLAGKIAGQGAA